MRLAAALLAVLALACGDTLVDHAGTAYFAPAGGGLLCDAPLHACGDACVAEDVSSCGPTCAPCTTTVPGAVPVCASHACGFECTGGLLRCGDACCGATAIAAGAHHTCAITSAGGVKCWGANDAGQLGAGLASASEPFPIDVPGLSGAAAIAAGGSHTCAVLGDGGVRCWGANASGQVGDGTATERRSPIAVTLPAPATAIAAGELHTCAVAGGSVYCWGDDASGQLGTPASSATPVAVPVAASSIAAGRLHTCAVLASTGGVECWGANDAGQAGTGSVSAVQPTPAAAGTIAGVSAIAAGGAHTCAVVGAGKTAALWCWGSDADQQLGIGASGVTVYASPTQIAAAPSPAAALAAGRAHTCATKAETGGMKCFGADASGQLGAPGVSKNDVSIPFTASAPWQVAAGGDHTCTILVPSLPNATEGVVACWGSNASGELGDGTAADRAAPAPVSGR